MTYYVMDIDGTLANCDHRLHHIQKDQRIGALSVPPATFGCTTPSVTIERARQSKSCHRGFVSGQSDEPRCKPSLGWKSTVGLFRRIHWMRAGRRSPDDTVVKIEILERMIENSLRLSAGSMAFDEVEIAS